MNTSSDKNIWTCSKCGRVFNKGHQPHSCAKIPLQQHFINKDRAKELFDYLFELINKKIGKCQLISLSCCIHLFGSYDFLAAIPKKNGLEIRFALDRKLDSSRLKVCVPMSTHIFKNCFEISSKGEIDNEFVDWLKESYALKN